MRSFSFPNVKRSFGDIASVTILGDVGQLGIGYTIVFCYVLVMLGRWVVDVIPISIGAKSLFALIKQ